MNLYKIQNTIRDIIEKGESVDEETGEIFDLEALESLQDSKEVKCLSIGKYIKNLTYEASMVKEEKDNLSKREKSIKTKIKNLTNLLEVFAPNECFKDGQIEIKYKKQQDELIVSGNIEIIPKEFKREKHTVEVDKVELKKFLKENNCDYAYMQPRPNKVVVS